VDKVHKKFKISIRTTETATALVNHCVNEDVFLLGRELLSPLTRLGLCDMGILEVTGEGTSVNMMHLRELPQRWLQDLLIRVSSDSPLPIPKLLLPKTSGIVKVFILHPAAVVLLSPLRGCSSGH